MSNVLEFKCPLHLQLIYNLHKLLKLSVSSSSPITWGYQYLCHSALRRMARMKGSGKPSKHMLLEENRSLCSTVSLTFGPQQFPGSILGASWESWSPCPHILGKARKAFQNRTAPFSQAAFRSHCSASPLWDLPDKERAVRTSLPIKDCL